jgi:L-threonylcarbamoyladenylate synthase
MPEVFEKDIMNCLAVLKNGGTILYPTDTVWGIGCDATNALAVQKVFDLKKREQSRALIVLLAEERDILKYVAAPDLHVFDFLSQQIRPTTIVFENAVGLPENLIASDGSVALRIVKDAFCVHLIKRFRKPLVSTSANIHGEVTPSTFKNVKPEILRSVDYIVNWKRENKHIAQPSQIVKWNQNGTTTTIRS